MQDKLERIGLTEREAAVYIATLELGLTGALQISRKTGINRPMVYAALESLKQRGLVEVQLKGLKQKFAAANPDQFDAIIRDHKKTFDDALPELLALYKLKGERSNIKYYEGIEGLKSVFETILREVKIGDPYYVIDDQSNWGEHLPWLESFIERRARKQLDFRIIFPDSERGRYNLRMAAALNQKVKLAPHAILTDMIVTPQRYVTHDFAPPITTVVIENQSIVQNQLQLFRYIWDTLPD